MDTFVVYTYLVLHKGVSVRNKYLRVCVCMFCGENVGKEGKTEESSNFSEMKRGERYLKYWLTGPGWCGLVD